MKKTVELYCWRSMTVIAILLCCIVKSSSQDPSGVNFGIVPNGAYESYHIDSVNMESGVGVIHIPLFTLPQRGKLALSFSINANTPTWRPLYSCDPEGECDYEYQSAIAFGPNIGLDQAARVGASPNPTSYCYLSQGFNQCITLYQLFLFSVRFHRC